MLSDIKFLLLVTLLVALVPVVHMMVEFGKWQKAYRVGWGLVISWLFFASLFTGLGYLIALTGGAA